MKTFKYVVQDSQGKKVSGLAQMEDRGAMFSFFRERNYRVLSVDLATGLEITFQSIADSVIGIRGESLAMFMRQLATLVHSGLPLAQALESLAFQEKNQRFRITVASIKDDIEKGTPFSEALAKYPNLFSPLMVGMVQAGEVGGILDEVLQRIASIGLQELEVRSKLRAALTYPLILVGIAIVVLSFLLIGAVPKFLDIFRSSQVELPLATKILLNTSGFLRRFWYLILGGIGAGIFSLSAYYRTSDGRLALDRLLLKFPIFGDVYLKIAVTRLTRSISSLTKSGIPLLRALDISKGVTTNVVVLDSIDKIRSGISQGKNLTDLFQASGIFPPMVIQMVSVGETTGKLDEMLSEVAQYYDLELEYFLRNLTSSLEPILLLLMGLMVGFIALAVLMPVFNLVKVFRQ